LTHKYWSPGDLLFCWNVLCIFVTGIGGKRGDCRNDNCQESKEDSSYKSQRPTLFGISSTAFFLKASRAWYWWLTPLILGSQEAEIRRTVVQKLAWANASQDPISKKACPKKGWWSG
jgi:hypothetical protein